MGDGEAVEIVRGEPGEVTCVLRDPAGETVASATLVAAPVEIIGGRVFWVYSDRIEPGAPADARLEMLNAARAQLESEFAPGEPVGVFAAIGDREWLALHPEAVWPGAGFTYAGYMLDGRQARIRYFEGARI